MTGANSHTRDMMPREPLVRRTQNRLINHRLRPVECQRRTRSLPRPQRRPAALVRVYEKLRQGIWSDKGLFALLGYEYKKSGRRKVFKFKMQLADIPDEPNADDLAITLAQFRRAIPSWIKQIVYKRDKGQCVLCGSRDQLHFDHDLPHSKGGTGLKSENVRILCARHNLPKGARIE